jgi:SAM-dependent methyltransferase
MSERKGQDFNKERAWHEQKFYMDSGHWTSHPLFASRERHWLKNHVDKIRFYGYLHRFIKKELYADSADILIAPVGDGYDLEYLQGIFKNVHGMDLSPIALAKCPNIMVKKEGDILNSGYEDESFDIIICSLFLHHVHDIGFEPFIKEYSRLLRKGGVLAIFEPSALYPMSLIFAFLNKTMGNVTGKIKGERPISPPNLNRILGKIGFEHIYIRGITFNHVRFPCWMQLFIDLLDYPLRYFSPFNLFSESIGWYCKK